MKLDYNELIQQALNERGSLSAEFSRFYNYSYRNQLLLKIQGASEPVATYNNWRKLNRQVKKGSKAREILRPIIIDKDTDDEKMFFKLIKCLFVLSDTEGEPLPEYQYIETWDRARALEQLKITEQDFKMTNGNIGGYATGARTVAINPLETNKNAVLFHELAHIVLDHHNSETARDIKEFQAEMTAYILSNELQTMTDKERENSRGYIQNWLSGQTPTEKDIKPIFTAVDKILRAGRETKAKA